MDARERNRLANVYSREAAHIIVSPFRISEYVKYRLRGYSKEKALDKVKK